MTTRTRPGHHGTGPGEITPDGCPVEFYLRLPVGDEPGIIESAVPPRARILELGCGVGRVTRPLLERGFTVTAVDESPQMLAHVHGTRTVCSPIEDLDLGGETFDVVMLASFLVHTGDAGLRRALLRTCARHLAPDGCVLIQREGEDYYTNVPRERTHPSGFTMRIASVEPAGDGVNSVRLEYAFPDVVWTQTFRTRPLTSEQFDAALAEAGLKTDAYLTEDRTWVRAVLAG
ncbi:class I SAM-dependent methyltransferase [Streptomyces sp. URMC 127]|uniref:class I SAM-dependent methyltransferase n=1 Tax=Streptomyces sp. URMC 127 TaxID=3423402 RepID=UPI003F1D2471